MTFAGSRTCPYGATSRVPSMIRAAIDARRDRRGRAAQRFVDGLVVALGAGRPFADACAVAGNAAGGRWQRLAADLIVADVVHGDIDTFLDRWARMSSGDDALIACGCRLARSLGGEPTLALGSAAVVVRERQRLRDDAALHATQARASIVALTLAPLAFVGVAAVSGVSPLPVLVGTPTGRWAAIAAVALEGAGLAWMRVLNRRAFA